VYGVRRSETKYQTRLATISISTMIAPTRLPLPGLDAGGGGGDSSAIGAATLSGFGDGGDFSLIGAGVSTGLDGGGDDFSLIGAEVSSGFVDS
jgi:hypothetical protein